jgi:fumarate reductase subunit C
VYNLFYLTLNTQRKAAKNIFEAVLRFIDFLHQRILILLLVLIQVGKDLLLQSTFTSTECSIFHIYAHYTYY